ncbi:peroxidase [Citrus sinensis]|uniref:Peroxidase n=1 Tax=Citrus sinensis TaxID=2711 RepID=A0ACB8JFZ3_CITSI|nr:peroxidase [Citrus sinensis]
MGCDAIQKYSKGCDASVLLDDTSSFTGEKSANANANSIRGFEVIDSVKSKVESLCPGVVSCADILAVAARDSVVAFGGPSWTVQLGAHTIGQARCILFRQSIYNETNIDSEFATSLKSNCPSSGGDDNLSPLDATSSVLFDNGYFRDLVNNKGVFHSEQQLFNGGSTDSQVTTYSTIIGTFYADFANAMVKMGNLSPLTGTDGQIRTNCRKIN